MKAARLIALLTIAAACMAQAETNIVSSANVVGYIQVVDPASNRLALVSAPFNSGTGTVSTLLDVFGTNQLRQSAAAVRCDQVLTWDLAQQRYVQYVQKTNGFFYYYTNFSGTAVNPSITRGQALWIRAPSATYAPTEKTIYISGNVPSDGSYTNTVLGNSGNPMNFLANPYPVEMELSSLISTNDGAKGSAVASRADRVFLWDSVGQQYINLALRTPTNKWFYYTNFTATSAPDIRIQPGQGFWYRTTNSFTWIESKVYTLQ